MGFVFVVVGIVASLLAAPVWAGHSVGNGGDAVFCWPSPLNDIDGTYSLDWLLTYRASSRNRDVPTVASLEASLDRIEGQMAAKAPELLASWKEFRGTIRNEDDYTQARVWEEAAFGLVDLDDQEIVAAVPDNCRDSRGVKVSVIQAVVRQDPAFSGSGDKIIYKFVPKVWDDLAKKDPLQLSFLVVHEWLWDVSGNVDRNRRINRFLHSDAWTTLSREDARKQLAGMGLNVDQMRGGTADASGFPRDLFAEKACQGEALGLATARPFFSFGSDHAVLGLYRLGIRHRACSEILGCGPWETVRGFAGKADNGGAAQDVAMTGKSLLTYRDGIMSLRLVGDRTPGSQLQFGNYVEVSDDAKNCAVRLDDDGRMRDCAMGFVREGRYFVPDYGPLLDGKGRTPGGMAFTLPRFNGVVTNACFQLSARANHGDKNHEWEYVLYGVHRKI